MVSTAAVADPNLSRQLASNLLEALKKAGHILIAKGKTEALLRDLATEIEPTLARVIPSILRAEGAGEIKSTFGDEATDEAVEELVVRLREHLIDSEGIEDVFADDNVIERVIFRTLHEGLVHSAHAAAEEEEDEPPPISVRLDTLGYVASTASKLSDSETLKDALERAALAASTELDTFDPSSRTAFFAASDDDPDKRLEIEEAVEEELADLVEMGLVDLPTSVRLIPLPRVPSDQERKVLRTPLNELAARVLTSRVCPGTWDWDGAKAIKLTFTPMSEPDAKTVDALVGQFTRELDVLFGDDSASSKAEAPAPRRAAEIAAPKAAPATTKASPKKTVAAETTSAKGLVKVGSAAAPSPKASSKKTSALTTAKPKGSPSATSVVTKSSSAKKGSPKKPEPVKVPKKAPTKKPKG